MIAAALGLPVEHHDDGSVDGMYDLRIGPAEAPQVAIEVVGAVNSAYARTRSAGPGWGPAQTLGRSDWLLFLEDGTVAERLRREVGSIVLGLEHAGWNLNSGHEVLRATDDDKLVEKLTAQGILAAYCTAELGSGTVRFAQHGQGGAPDHRGDSVPGWTSDFLRHPDRADVLAKLERSGAVERHVFVEVCFKGAPFAIWNYLVGPIEGLPAATPTLPAVVSQVWLTTGFSVGRRPPQGIRWDGGAWSTFGGRGGDPSEVDEDTQRTPPPIG